MAHICAVAGREPVKVSENSGSEALDQGPEACASRVRPAGNEKSSNLRWSDFRRPRTSLFDGQSVKRLSAARRG